MRSILSLASFLVLIGSAIVSAQDANEQSATGKVVVSKHVFKFQAGDVYEAVAEGKNFQPQITVDGQEIATSMPAFKFDQATRFVNRTFLMPRKSGDFAVVVSYSPFGTKLDQALDYKIVLKRFRFSKTPIFEKQDKLAADDPVYKDRNLPHKEYPITLKSGKFYMIDMVRKKTLPMTTLDPYLCLEDTKPAQPFQRVVAQDDDSGGDLNARITYQATKDGDFRIIATSVFKSLGEYTITVREQE